jgi:hypothetical protein
MTNSKKWSPLKEINATFLASLGRDIGYELYMKKINEKINDKPCQINEENLTRFLED